MPVVPVVSGEVGEAASHRTAPGTARWKLCVHVCVCVCVCVCVVCVQKDKIEKTDRTERELKCLRV